MTKISYGLYVLTARDGKKDNGCIINTASQVTISPNRITIAVSKLNFTHDMIVSSGKFNVSCLTEETPFKVFQHFGYQSGRSMDKFENCENEKRSENGLLYLPRYTNAFISGNVVTATDLGTHTLFLADVAEAAILTSDESLTYSYYFKNIKPAPQPTSKKGWRCKICGYIYEGEVLPPDFICPICKHPASDFERIK